MNYSLLAYLFLSFSIGLVCLGVVVAVVHHTRSPVARAFLAFYAFLTVSVLAGLLLSFLDVLPGSVAPETQTVLEYLEAMVGFYGILFTLPLFAHRVFAVPKGRRDGILLAIVGVAFVAQHVTEYGFGGRWDARGDFFENLLFAAVVAYTLALGIRRLGAPGVDRTLAIRLLVCLGLGAPTVLHDLFLMDVTGLRFYPLLYSAFSIVIAWTLYRRAGTAIETSVPPEWNLTDRESEVVSLVLQGLSNKEIAAELFISTNTVKTHLRAVFDKSGCRSRFALMSALARVQVPTGNPAENAIH
jgi:DNA-binding CsgD family transcriptional regulator